MRTIEIIAEVTGASKQVASNRNVYYRITFDTLGYSVDGELVAEKLSLINKGIKRPLSLVRASSNDGDRSQYGVYESYCAGIMEYGNVVRLVVEEHVVGVTEYIDKKNNVCKHGTKQLEEGKVILGDIQYELKEAYQVGNSELYRIHKSLDIATPIAIFVAGVNRAIMSNKSTNLFGE